MESDLEGERVERIRHKTAMTPGRIPSMVAITPPISDEEVGPQAPLRIAIPDVYALPDKRKTVSTNGILETNLDAIPQHYTVKRQVPAPDYVSLNAIIDDNSLERRRTGARVTLDSDGKVVYASDSLRRKKDHTTFAPGKFVRDEPTPSPTLGQRTPKPVRPIHRSGLVRTNGDVPSKSRSVSPKDDRRSPRLGKVFVRSAVRVVSPSSTLEKKHLALNLRPSSPALSTASSSTKRSADYEEGKIIGESALDALGQNNIIESDFTKQIDNFKLDIFQIEVDPPAKHRVKRSDSYKLANSPLSIARKLTAMAPICELAVVHHPPSTPKHRRRQLRIDPSIFLGRSPSKVTKPGDTEIAKFLRTNHSNTDIW